MAKILTQKSTVFFIFKCQRTCIFIIRCDYNSIFCSLLIEYKKCKQILDAFCELENKKFYWVIFTPPDADKPSAMTLMYQKYTIFDLKNELNTISYFLPRCEYWTIGLLWCATGGNLEKNLLDSSISLSTLSSESFTLLFSEFKSWSSRMVAELRPKGLNPRVAASFVIWSPVRFFQ